MTRTEHLLFILAEEGAEIGHRASKAARFGLSEFQPGQSATNSERIVWEYADLVAVMEMLEQENAVRPSGMRALIEAKKRKVEKFLEYSRRCGTLAYPCHSKEKEAWCDSKGPAGFMGHTCVS